MVVISDIGAVEYMITKDIDMKICECHKREVKDLVRLARLAEFHHGRGDYCYKNFEKMGDVRT